MRTILASVLLLATGLPASALTFSDGDFTNATVEVVGDSTAVVTLVPSGGVGDSALLRVQTILGPPSNDLTAGVLLASAVWDTAVLGAIASIDLSLLAREFDAVLQGQAVGVFLRDGGGNLYRGGSVITGIPASFTAVAVTGLGEASFVQVDDANPNGVTPVVHPDFSSGVFELGFFGRNTCCTGTTLDYDDIQITVTPVPEPTTGLLVLMGLLATAGGRSVAAR